MYVCTCTSTYLNRINMYVLVLVQLCRCPEKNWGNAHTSHIWAGHFGRRFIVTIMKLGLGKNFFRFLKKKKTLRYPSLQDQWIASLAFKHFPLSLF